MNKVVNGLKILLFFLFVVLIVPIDTLAASKPVKVKNGYYMLQTKMNGGYNLGIANNKNTNKTKLLLLNKQQRNEQVFYIKRVNKKSNWYTIQNVYSGKYLTVSSKNNKASVYIYTKNNNKKQYFQFFKQGNGYKIKSVFSNKILSINSQKAIKNSSITSCKDKNKKYQIWVLKKSQKFNSENQSQNGSTQNSSTQNKQDTNTTQKKKTTAAEKTPQNKEETVNDDITINGVNIHFSSAVPQTERKWYVDKLKAMPNELTVNVSDLYIKHTVDEMMQGQRDMGYSVVARGVLGFTHWPTTKNQKSVIYLRSMNNTKWEMHCDLDNLYHEFGHALDMHIRYTNSDNSYSNYSSFPEWTTLAIPEWKNNSIERMWFSNPAECIAESISWYYNDKLDGKPNTKALVEQLIKKKGTNLFWDYNPWE